MTDAASQPEPAGPTFRKRRLAQYVGRPLLARRMGLSAHQLARLEEIAERMPAGSSAALVAAARALGQEGEHTQQTEGRTRDGDSGGVSSN